MNRLIDATGDTVDPFTAASAQRSLERMAFLIGIDIILGR
jgi:hypothetical protein